MYIPKREADNLKYINTARTVNKAHNTPIFRIYLYKRTKNIKYFFDYFLTFVFLQTIHRKYQTKIIFLTKF